MVADCLTTATLTTAPTGAFAGGNTIFSFALPMIILAFLACILVLVYKRKKNKAKEERNFRPRREEK